MTASSDNHHAAIARAKPSWRWLQFRSRSLLLLLAAAAVLLAAWQVYSEPYRQQRQTGAMVDKVRGRVVSVHDLLGGARDARARGR